ncbi:MAG: cell division protein FtsZ [Candidatus Methanomethylophilaceae archaeon]|nr:cell division protein FtsZ [Candidatus Methanomethylophilaceae archaeon]
MAPIFTKDMPVEARTAVIGVGGAGCRMVSDIYWDLPSVDTVAVNTDKDTLLNTDADRKLFICKAVTKGEGTKGDSLLGRRCAQAHMEEIEEMLSHYDVVYIVAGMGGGTGSGAAPIIAEIAQRLNLVVFSIAVNPFSFETARTKTARDGVAHLRSVCPMTVVIENDLVLDKMGDLSMNEAFGIVNKSVSAYIMKQQKKVGSTFLEQFAHLGDFVKDPNRLPENRAHKGVAIN